VTEADAIDQSDRPSTYATLREDLFDLGVATGDIVIVHSSLSAMGFVAGGAQTVVEALLDAVGPAGTIVVPTQSGQLSDPANWSDPPVPVDWVDTVRAALPAYDPYRTPVRAMGRVVETLLIDRATIRSAHPLASFAARGPAAATLMADHRLSPALGEGSPLSKLYDANAKIALLGVGHANNTSLHLAEHRADWPSKTFSDESAPVMVDGHRQWLTWRDLELGTEDFDAIGRDFAAESVEAHSTIGRGVARLCRVRDCVDFAVGWMERHRS
jgi:aminoglycoside 3-N-acetyltransferase